MAGKSASSSAAASSPAPQVGRTIIQLTAEDGAALDKLVGHAAVQLEKQMGIPVQLNRTQLVRSLIAKGLSEAERVAAEAASVESSATV